MKEAFISSLALCMFAITLQAKEPGAQKERRLYIRPGAGYAFAHAGDLQAGSYNGTASYSGSTLLSSSDNYKLKKGSFGAGVHAVIAGGFMLQKHLGVELAVGVGVKPKKYESETIYKETGSSPTYTYQFNQKVTTYQKLPVLIMPSIVMQTGGSKLNAYTRIGVALPVSGKMVQETKATENNGGPTTNGGEWTTELKTRFSVGLQGALGVQLKLDDRIAIYVEANGLSMNSYAKKSTVTKYVINNMDLLSSMPMSEKETEYEMDYTVTNVQNDNVATKEASFSLPMSNIGLGAGIVINL